MVDVFLLCLLLGIRRLSPFAWELFRIHLPPSPWLENLKRAEQTRIDTHKCTCVVELSTVVRCWEYGNQLSVCKEFIAILDYLAIQQLFRLFITLLFLVQVLGEELEGDGLDLKRCESGNTWWARHTRSRSCFLNNSVTLSAPKV